MRKAIVKIIAFLAVFFVSLITISFVMNQGNTDMTAEMGKATLPSMAVVENGTEINQMYGYTAPMETAGLRESITTVDSTRQVDAVVHLYGQELSGISYELRSIDGSRLIEKTELTGTKDGDSLHISFRLKDLMEEGEEYSLIFVAGLEDGREARYYTRVIQADYGLEEKLETRVGALSGGQRQVLALLMATMTPIDFLILDEHTAALDPRTAEIVMELTDRIVREKKMTTIMVTHNLRYALEYGDRLLMMHQGKAVLDKEGEEKKRLKVEEIMGIFNRISVECGN